MEEKQNQLEFIKEITDRAIEHLIHFTPTINLLSIFEQERCSKKTTLTTLY